MTNHHMPISNKVDHIQSRTRVRFTSWGRLQALKDVVPFTITSGGRAIPEADGHSMVVIHSLHVDPAFQAFFAFACPLSHLADVITLLDCVVPMAIPY
jgi:hypothetical protein